MLKEKKNSNPVSWQFVGPTNYNIIINSTTDYGQLQSVSFSGTPQFGIHSSSTLACATTYTSVLLGVSSSNLAATRTGTYNGIDWTVALQDGSTTTWDLTTDSCNTLPTLSSSVPADDASSVARDANIILNFSENVDVESGNITIKKTSNNSTVETIDVTSSQVTGTGTSQITINPSSNFETGIEYYVLIDATAFDDTESGSYAGISSTTALSFTVDSNVLPTLSSSVPADDATSVERDANIVLNFSEIVDVETGNITIKKTTDDSTFETIDVSSSNVTGTGTTQITINPTSNFDDEVEYYVLIDATAFDDSESGSYAGISSTTALSFTTGKSDPTNDKVVTGSIDAQVDHARLTFVQSVGMVSSRLGYLRHNRNNNNLSKKQYQIRFW